MAQLVLLVGAGLTGLAGYNEAAKFERRLGRRPWSLPAPGTGVVCFFAGLVVALLAAPFVVGALIGVVAYNQAVEYQRQHSQDLLDLPAPAWGVAVGLFGLMGALLTSTLASGIVCGFAAFGGALYLLVAERKTLIAEKNMWIAENRRLLAEKNAKPQGGGPTGSPEPASVEAPSRRPREAWAAPARQWGAEPPRSWGAPPEARDGRQIGGEHLLPRR